ncbi:MAG: hypothetical protein IJU75_00455 [Clostridia bacterium]|nr:hypothetical protein [Clostridia bacterium]
MKRRRTILIVSIIVAIVVIAAGITVAAVQISKSNVSAGLEVSANEILNKVQSEGFMGVKDVTFENDNTIRSTASASGEKLGPEDIDSLRAIRNAARSLIESDEDLSGKVNNIRNVITDENGDEIYDVIVNDFCNIPDEFTNSHRIMSEKSGKSSDETLSAISSKFEELGVKTESLSLENGTFNGFCAVIKMVYDVEDELGLNWQIERILIAVDGLNADGYSIAEYNVSINDTTSGEQIFYMSSDLIHRDFLWWQSPKLGYQTWTGSTPKLTQE